MSPTHKPLKWVGSCRSDLCEFPDDARREAGHQLRQVQAGYDPDRWKPVKTVGAGVQEIIIAGDDAFRVFYVATFADAIYVLHAFQKTTEQTSQHDLYIGRDRYQMVQAAQSLLKKQQKKASKGSKP